MTEEKPSQPLLPDPSAESPQPAPQQTEPQPESEALSKAEADLAQVRDVLAAAGRGEADAAQVKASLQGYLHENGPSLQAAAAELGEEVRQRTLEELYKWRAQLNAQLQAREGASSAEGGGQAETPRSALRAGSEAQGGVPPDREDT